MSRRTPNNMESVIRAKRVHAVIMILSALVGGFLLVNTLLGLRKLNQNKQSITLGKAQIVDLSNQSAQMRSQDLDTNLESCGLDAFALQLTRWANAHNVDITSLVPEGVPVATDVEIDGAKLGSWNAGKVRVNGAGAFSDALALLYEFRTTVLPIQLESYTVKTSDSKDDKISFELILTVYEKKTGTS